MKNSVHNHCLRALLLLATLIGLASLAFGLVRQAKRLPNVAEQLPLETQAFSVVNSKAPVDCEGVCLYTWQEGDWSQHEAGEPFATPNGPLAGSIDYENVRNRLSYEADALLYLTPDLFKAQWAGEWWPILDLAKAAGLTAKFHTEKEWTGESFIAIDKSKLSTGYFAQPEERYKAKLWAQAPEAQIVIGGLDLKQNLLLINQHLQDIQPAAVQFLPDPSTVQDGEFLLIWDGENWETLYESEFETASLDESSHPLLPGSDFLLKIRWESGQKMSIILDSGIKVFDDGIMSRHHLIQAAPENE